MSQYLFLFKVGDAFLRSAEENQADIQKWTQWMDVLAQQGKLVGAQALNPTGKIVKRTGKVVTDGPFMEGKEMIGGYLQCKANSYEEAVEIARGCPILEFESGQVEVREVLEMKM
jgi:hypothetical protein